MVTIHFGTSANPAQHIVSNLIDMCILRSHYRYH